MNGLYADGRSLHDVALNIDEALQTGALVSSGSGNGDDGTGGGRAATADPVGAERLSRMSVAAQEMLRKYQQPVAEVEQQQRATGDDVTDAEIEKHSL